MLTETTQKEYAKAYYNLNRERLLVYGREYKKTDRAKELERGRREYNLARHKKYYARNKDKWVKYYQDKKDKKVLSVDEDDNTLKIHKIREDKDK